MCNSLCGFAAILYTLRIYENKDAALNIYSVSAYIIFGAMIFDALDGFVARLLDASSLEGVEMDSLSDMVTFGVAPATIVAIMTHTLRVQNELNMGLLQEILVYSLCSIYIGGAALRLAKYNIKAMFPKSDEKKQDKELFSGLPSPGAAAAICVVVLAAPSLKIPAKHIATFLPIYAAFLGLLMVSNVPYRHAARWLFSIKHNKKRLVLLILMLLVIAIFRTMGLALVVSLYVLSGMLNLLIKQISSKKKD